MHKLNVLIASPEQSDALIEKQYGQDVIDSLSVLEAIAPTFHQDLCPKLVETFPMLDFALRSRFAIIRQSAARCFATICNVMTLDAMRYVVQHLVPLLGDALVLTNRQGATELIYRSYIIFLVASLSLTPRQILSSASTSKHCHM